MPLWVVVGLFLLGSVLISLYVFYARRAESPILDLKTPEVSDVPGGNRWGAHFFESGSALCHSLLPLQLQLGFGMTPLSSGLLTFVAAVGAIGMKTAAGTILKRFGFRTVLMFNAIVSGAMIAAPAFFYGKDADWYHAGNSLCRRLFPVIAVYLH